MGDGGSGGDPGNRAQNLNIRLGKLLRLNVDKRGARWQVAGYGLRNPWRFSFDRLTHDLYIGDVGQNAWEEVDVRTPRQQRSLNNYGWRVWEGRSRYTPGQQVNPRGALVFPIVVYSHSRGLLDHGRLRLPRQVDHLGSRPLLLRRLLQRHDLEPAHVEGQARRTARGASRSTSRTSRRSARTRPASSTRPRSSGTVYKLAG